MSSVVSQLSNEAILIIKYAEPFEPEKDVPGANNQIAKLEKQFKGEFYRIADLTEVNLKFSDTVRALSELTSGENGSLSANNRMQSVFVGDGRMIELAVKSLSQEQYGNIKSQLFTSVDDAIRYARTQLAKK